MLGVYFSGTGNTKYCLELLLSELGEEYESVSLESDEIKNKISENEVIFLAYPTQFSNVPYIVRDFINTNKELWNGKKVLCMTTMGAFSGDGAGCAARVLQKCGAEIIGGLHVHMPDAVCDNKMLKKSLDENRRIVDEAREKIRRVAGEIRNGKYPQEGLNVFYHMAGLFGQRLWFYNKTTGYSKGPKISDACVGCGMCERVCPMGNLAIKDGRAINSGKCAMCYRCISGCPKQAITLLGKEVIEQCRVEKYI